MLASRTLRAHLPPRCPRPISSVELVQLAIELRPLVKSLMRYIVRQQRSFCSLLTLFQRIKYLDSAGGRGKSVTDSLMSWLEREHADKNGARGVFEPDLWTRLRPNTETEPQQVGVAARCCFVAEVCHRF